MKAKKVYEFINPRERNNPIDPNIGMVKQNEKQLFEYDPIEDKLKIRQSVDLCCRTITEIPVTELYMPEHELVLNFSNIKKLPNNITVKSLYMEECNNFSGEWPENIDIDYMLKLNNTNIKTLPENLEVDILDISHTPISKIPESIIIYKELYIIDTNIDISELPNHLRSKIIKY